MRRRRYLVLTGGLSLCLAGCTESAQNDPETSGESTEGSDGDTVEVVSDADVATVDIEYEGHWSGSVGNAGSLRTVDGNGPETIDVPLEDTQDGQRLLQLDNADRDGRTVRASIEKADDGTGTLTVRISIEGDVVSEGSTIEGSDRVDLTVTVVRSEEALDDEPSQPDDNDSEPGTEPADENATDETGEPDEQGEDTTTDETTEDNPPAGSDSEPEASEDSTGSSPDETTGDSDESDGANEPDEEDTTEPANDSDESTDSGSPDEMESEPGTEATPDDTGSDDTG